MAIPSQYMRVHQRGMSTNVAFQLQFKDKLPQNAVLKPASKRVPLSLKGLYSMSHNMEAHFLQNTISLPEMKNHKNSNTFQMAT